MGGRKFRCSKVPTWIEAEFNEHWTLSADELTLLPGMADKGRLRGRLGFAIQLKFMQLHGRFPECHEEIGSAATQWLATQLHTLPQTSGVRTS